MKTFLRISKFLILNFSFLILFAACGRKPAEPVEAGPPPAVPSTFVATHQDIVVFWTLLRRSLAYHGGPFAALPPGAPRRLVGDLAAGGKGEWLF